jgi:hypothetical protein
MSYRLFSKTSLLATLLCITTLLTPILANAADTDGDGVDDSTDNCLLVANPTQADVDGDSHGDICDDFPNDSTEWVDTDKDLIGNNADTDDDNDNILDSIPDNCPLTPNADQKNWDLEVHAQNSNTPLGDGLGDVCDDDDDNDGVPDTTDLFPHNAAESADNDKDGIGDNADLDDDNDSILDSIPDNCPLISNKDQKNTDSAADGGDLCDDDDDNDGYPDGVDAFPLDKTEWSDRDGDGIGDNSDNDNDNDNKPDVDADYLKEDTDDDNDTVNDYWNPPTADDHLNPPYNTIIRDNCQFVANTDQADMDLDGIGDACDDNIDGDNHLNGPDVLTKYPQAPVAPAPVPPNEDTRDQLSFDPSDWQDKDKDTHGDIADWDDDDKTEWADKDGDGVGDNRDPDADGDGIPDRIEDDSNLTVYVDPQNTTVCVASTFPGAIKKGLNSLDSSDAAQDLDCDSHSNLAEYLAGSSIKSSSDTPDTVTPKQYKMVTKLGASGDSFGSNVAILGTTAIVGIPNGHLDATVSGGAHLFATTDSGASWQQSNIEFKPPAPNGINNDHLNYARLGKAVAIANNSSGNHVLLSADGNNDSGVVYVYNASGAKLQTITAGNCSLISTDPNHCPAGQGFGNSIAVYGDTALISAPLTKPETGSGSAAGAVYVYVLNASTERWDYEATLRGSDTAAQHFFGSSIALENNRAVIGASGVNVKANVIPSVYGANIGKVYVFERSSAVWSQTASFSGSDSSGGDYFGSSVALSGDTLVVGAIGVSDAGANSGAAYVFKLNGSSWDEQKIITAPDAAAQLSFGHSALMLNSETIMIGTPQASNRTTSNSGAVYIYRLSSGDWLYNGKLQSHDRQSGDFFGNNLAYSSSINRLLTGAPGVDDNGDGAGAVYAFDLSTFNIDADTDTIDDLFDNCTGVSNSDQSDIDGDGKGDVCDDDIDGDGVLNGSDDFPTDPSETKNTDALMADGDLLGDNIDPDADADGIPDRIEEATKLYDANNTLIGKLEWLDTTDATDDLDGDGSSNLAEYLANTAINDKDDKPDDLAASYTKLITNDGALNDNFGSSIAISGDYAIIGAPGARSNGISSGVAYIFERDSSSGAWSQKIKLVASDPATLAKFGSSVAIHGDFAVVGAPGVSVSGYSNAGAVYLFQRVNGLWSQTDKLTAAAPGTNHYFGSSVSIGSATRLVVGAPGAHKNAYISNSGAAYIFESNNSAWQETKLIGFDSKGKDTFGASVAMSGDNGDEVLVGAPYADAKNYATGAVYRFHRDNFNSWSEKSRMTADDGVNGDQFGSSVAFVSFTQMIGATPTSFGAALIGAPGRDRDAKSASSGAAYLFDYEPTADLNSDPTWKQSAKFEASDGAKSDTLGRSVALTFSINSTGQRSATALVGAKYRDGENVDSGAAFLFTQAAGQGWVQQRTLTANNGMSYDYFGSSIAIDSNKRLLIGAEGIDDNDIEAGAAFIVTYDDVDGDSDGIYNSFDNCRDVANSDQVNTDQNLENSDTDGNACDDDDDNDGVNDVDANGNSLDIFPLDPNEQLDTDKDGVGNNTDKDDDNDTIPDTDEIAADINPLIPTLPTDDKDKDGLSDLREYQLKTGINDRDSDNDGDSDYMEVYYGSDPLDRSSNLKEIIGLRPEKPTIQPIASPLALTVRTFDSSPFIDQVNGDNDPTDDVTDYLSESEWQINTTETFEASGRILSRNPKGASAAEEEKARKLTLSDGILLPGESYWIRTRHRDGKFWSEWSDPVNFTMTSEGDHFTTHGGIDDRYFAGNGYDANGDGTSTGDETEMKIIPLYNTGDSSIIGVLLSHGTFRQLSATAYSDLPATLTADGRMPYGLFNFRIEGLDINEGSPARTTVTFYLPARPADSARWYKYNASSNTLAPMNNQFEILENRVSLTLVDGGDFDADGVVNGVIVDPSGLYVPISDEEKLSNYKAGAFSPIMLLGLLLCWPLRRLVRKA